MKGAVSFLRKQESRSFMRPKCRSPGPAFGQARLCRLGRAELFHSAKVLLNCWLYRTGAIVPIGGVQPVLAPIYDGGTWPGGVQSNQVVWGGLVRRARGVAWLVLRHHLDEGFSRSKFNRGRVGGFCFSCWGVPPLRFPTLPGPTGGNYRNLRGEPIYSLQTGGPNSLDAVKQPASNRIPGC